MTSSESCGLPVAANALLDAHAQLLAQAEALDLGTFSPAELTEFIRRWEQAKRRVPAALDHRLVAEIDERHVAIEHAACSTAALLRQVLRVSPAEAKRLVQAAADLGPRRTLTGEVLPPLFTSVAAAAAAGVLSAEHARLITTTIDALPGAVEAEHGEWIQALLVDNAALFDPSVLARIAKRVVDTFDPDGALSDDADHERRRRLRLVERRDGSFDLSGRLTPECGALWQVVFDAYAAPVPAVDGARDNRPSEQRQHDVLAEIPALLMRAEQLPSVGGLVATLIVTMTPDELRTGDGYAETSHGGTLAVTRILELAPDTQIKTVVLEPSGAILDYGQTKRIVPPEMRRALYARDKGCTFPGCDRPPAWTEAHHFSEYVAQLGPTSIDNCGLVCGFHHREFGKRAWSGEIINGIPHWIPPAWIDPTQTPIRNTVHHTAQLAAAPLASHTAAVRLDLAGAGK